MSLPRYVFPQSDLNQLTFGRINGVGLDYDTKRPFAQNSQTATIREATKLSYIIGPSKVNSNLETFKSVKTRVDAMYEYYSTNYFDAHVGESLMKPLLQEELLNERKHRMFDLLAGNQLLYIEDFDYLAFPCGDSMSCVSVYTMKHHESLDYPDEKIMQLEFDTTVKQLARFHDKLAVRTLTGMYYVDLKILSDKTMGIPITKQIYEEPSHFAANPMILSDSVVALRKGDLVNWDFIHNTYNNRLGPIELWNADDDRWNIRRCEYAAHPRTLYLLESKKVSILDLRTDLSQIPSLVRHCRANDFFTSVAKFKDSPFQFSYSSASSTGIIDIRAPGQSLLEWNLNDPREHQFFVMNLQGSLAIPNRTSFCSYGRHHGEILVYTHRQNSRCPPSSLSVQKLVSFHKHKLISEPPLEFAPPIAKMETVTYPTFIKEREKFPSYPTLEGISFVQHPSKSKFTLLQLSGDGSVFAQAYSDSKDAAVYELPHEITVLESNIKFPHPECSSKCRCSFELLDLEFLVQNADKQIPESVIEFGSSSWTDLDLDFDPDLVETMYSMFSHKIHALEDSNGVPSIPPLLLANQSQYFALKTKLLSSGDLLDISPSQQNITDFIEFSRQLEYTQISRHAAEYSFELLESDLMLETRIFWPSSVEIEMESNVDEIVSHKSKMTSPLFLEPLELSGVPSWLLAQWTNENGISIEDQQVNSSQKGQIKSMKRRLAPARSSSSGSPKPTSVTRNASTQPMSAPTILPYSVRAASQPQIESKKKKRKGGF